MNCRPGNMPDMGAIFTPLLSNLILFSYLCKVIDTYLDII